MRTLGLKLMTVMGSENEIDRAYVIPGIFRTIWENKLKTEFRLNR